MQKTGQIERTVDREFTDEEAKFRMCVSVPCHGLDDFLADVI